MTVAELRAIGSTLAGVGSDHRGTQLDRIVELAEQFPDDAVGVVAALPPDLVPADVRDRVVAAWVRGGAADRFVATWAALLVDGDPDAVVAALLAQLQGNRPGPGFAFGATTFLEERLGAADRPPAAHERDLELLEKVLPPAHRRRIGIWQAHLGDAAAAAGRPEEAHRRWSRAVAARVPGASSRLAAGYAAKGRVAVHSGDPGSGAESYAKAYRLTGHVEFRLSELAARVLEDRVDPAELAAALVELDIEDGEVALWAGIARVAAGDPAAGVALLRRVADVPEAARLAQLAEIGADGPVELARSLLAAHGNAWTVHCTVEPDTIVDAVHHTGDLALLEQLLSGNGLLAGYPQRARLGETTRERAAHALLTAAMHQDVDVLVPRLELAERLLATEDR